MACDDRVRRVQPPSGRMQPGQKARNPSIPPGVPGAALPRKLGLLRIRSSYQAGASQGVSASPSEKRGVGVEAERGSGPGDPLCHGQIASQRDSIFEP